jgi:hypothetical protein
MHACTCLQSYLAIYLLTQRECTVTFEYNGQPEKSQQK